VESGETVREWRLERHGVDVRDSTFGQYVDERDAMGCGAAREGWMGWDFDDWWRRARDRRRANGRCVLRRGVGFASCVCVRVRACVCVLTASCV